MHITRSLGVIGERPLLSLSTRNVPFLHSDTSHAASLEKCLAEKNVIIPQVPPCSPFPRKIPP